MSEQRCVGCERTTGPPGAICPACHSQYPDPGLRGGAALIALVGAALVAVSLLGASAWFGAAGFFVLVFAAGTFRQSFGRVNYPRDAMRP